MRAVALPRGMRTYDFWRVDVFAAKPLEGNPLAVFPRAQGLTDEEMLAITREMNISETTFIVPSDKPEASYRNRIFSVGGEMPFAGHPSLGTAYVAAREGLVPVRDGVVTVRQEVKVGVLPIDLHVRAGLIDKVVMTQASPKLGPRVRDAKPLADALGIRARDIAATKLAPQIASTGIPSLHVPVRDLDLVREMAPDQGALGKVLRAWPGSGAYVFSFEAEGDADVHARGFFPNHGVPEDPATGSAAGACGAFLAANGRLPPKEWFVIEQGIEVHHPSRIEVSVAARGRKPLQVRVGGRVVTVMRGRLELP